MRRKIGANLSLRCVTAAATLPILSSSSMLAALEGAQLASQRKPLIDNLALMKAHRPSSSSSLGRRLLRHLIDAMRVLARAIKIFTYLSPLPALTAASYAIPYKAVDDAAWAYATGALQMLGPCFVKLAQWAATRRDLFPNSFCDRLSKVREGREAAREWSGKGGPKVLRYLRYEESFSHIIVTITLLAPVAAARLRPKALVDPYRLPAAAKVRRRRFCGRLRSCIHCDELHPNHNSNFCSFGDDYSSSLTINSNTPVIGSGCVAQVYLASASDGSQVAVKVIHPRVKAQIESDLRLLRFAATAVEKVRALQGADAQEMRGAG